MKSTLKFGIIIGLACSLWTYIMGFLGWYRDPVLLNLFWLVVIIEIVILFFALKQSGAENTYWQQVGSGTLMAVIGGVIIFILSYLFTTTVFPNYFKELEEINRQMLTDSGKTAEEVETLVNQMKAAQTPFMQALSGMLGTIFTGFIVSLIIGAIYKKKN